MNDDLRYPLGRWRPEGRLSPEARRERIDEIAAAPGELRRAVSGLSDERLDTPYRPEGWTVRQLVHHVADSHMNAFVRIRVAVTEETPPVTAYDQERWAELADSRSADPELSLALLDALHRRWVILLRSLAGGEFERTLTHPDHGQIDVDTLLSLYSWHGRHHVAHVDALRRRQGW